MDQGKGLLSEVAFISVTKEVQKCIKCL